MSQERQHNCKMYFVFKIQDLLNNSFHTFEEKRMESLQQYLGLCISTFEEYHISVDREKLKKSYIGLIEGLAYQLGKHTFKMLEKYKNDFVCLIGLIQQDEKAREKALYVIYRNMVTLKKKLESSSIVNHYIECINEIDDFMQMDILIETFISDLLNSGYSLAYLCDWFKLLQDEYVSNKDIDKQIEKLRDLERDKNAYEIYIKFSITSISQKEAAIELLERDFDIYNKEDISLVNPWKGKEYYIAKKKCEEMDSYKAIEVVELKFSEIKELFDMWQGTKNCIKDDPVYVWKNSTESGLIDVTRIANVKMLNYIDDSYKKQMTRFLCLKNSLESDEIGTLKRIMYTLNNAKNYKIQNRFLNFWSALEYTLHPFPKISIIEKARVVVPESFGLFYIKNKINIFWKRLMHYMKSRRNISKYSEIIKFIDECGNEDDYETKKLVEFFQDDSKTYAVLEQINKQIVLKREFMELQMLLTNEDKAIKIIEDYVERIRHDLNYIYRLRNQLIHSAKDTGDYLEYVSMRLYRYVNALLSTILYYEEKNSEYSIVDILCSIDATYIKYISDSKKKVIQRDREYKLVRPPYLFME